MAQPDRYIQGLMNNLENLSGTLSSPENLTGKLSNTTLRGESIQLRVFDGMLQYKYESDTAWTDLVDINTLDYSRMSNLPTINGVEIRGEIASQILTPEDEMTAEEILTILDG